MVFRCGPLFSFPVRFTPLSRGFEAIAFRGSPLEYSQGQTRLPARVPALLTEGVSGLLDATGVENARVFFGIETLLESTDGSQVTAP